MAPDRRLQRARQDDSGALPEGQKVLVRCRIHYTKWTDQQGNDRYGCEIIAESVDFLSRAKQAESATGQRDLDDDIPF